MNVLKILKYIIVIFIILSVNTYSSDGSYIGTTMKMIFDVYQSIISPVRSPVSKCQFTPSCSQYGKQAIGHYGFTYGIVKACDRLIRCSSGRASQDDYKYKNGKFIDIPYESHGRGADEIINDTTEAKPILSLSKIDNSLKLPYYLFAEEDYQNSMLELKKILINSGNDTLSNKLLILIGLNYLMLDEPVKALNYIGKLKAGNDIKSDKNAFIMQYLISDMNDTHLMSLNLCEKYKGTSFPGDTFALFETYTHVRAEEYSAADSIINIAYCSKLLTDNEFKKTSDLISSHMVSGSKSPFLTGLMSTVFPGAGYLYCGRYKEAASAFIINGLFAWGIYSLFENKNYGSGILLSMVTVPFYLGNIVGAVNSAHEINSREKELINLELRNTLRIKFYFSKDFFQTLWN